MIGWSRVWRAVVALALLGAAAPAAASAAAWTMHNPFTPRSAFSTQFDGVSCATATACTAVGLRLDKTDKSLPVAAGWNGTSWTLESMTVPSGTSSQLQDVSCPAANDCLAVGNATPNATPAFTERWNGTSWTLGSPATQSALELEGVSCFSSSACTAVGTYYNSTLKEYDPAAQRWNGTSWTVQSMPHPAGGGLLYKVSCPSATMCMATGQAIVGSAAVPFTELWNGTAWTLPVTPNPGTSGTNTQLESVSCSSATACEAVGGYRNSLGVFVPLAEGWNGSLWSVQSTPALAKGVSGALYGISCSTDGNCTAVGQSSGRIGLALIERFSGSGWLLSTPANPHGTRESQLYAASCRSASVCTVVGFVITYSEQSLAEAYNGTGWTVQATPNAIGPSSASMLGVSCFSPSACMAVGESLPNYPASSLTLAELWNGTSWVFERTVNPMGKTPTNEAIGNRFLTAVSCSSATACTAVGFYADSSNFGHFPMAEQWDGTTWTLQTMPIPSGATSGVDLTGVSCSSASACTAVGYSDLGTLAERWDGTSWTLQTISSPGGSSDSLNGVSCRSATDCIAVGYTLAGSSYVTLAEHWDGTSWLVQSTPNPAGATGAIVLLGVSCSATSACTAAGYWHNGSGIDATLAERWNGTSWTLQTTRNSNSSSTNRLEGVSCPLAGACTAAGTLSYQGTLAEAWNGTTWALQTTPNLSGQTTQTLAGVSCGSATDCIAVGSGYSSSGAGISSLLGEHYH